MGAVLQFLLRVLVPANLIRPALRPATRFAVSLVAVPVFRSVFRRCVKSEVHQTELEKDLEEWFRASILLFFCTANVEGLLFGELGFAPNDWLSVGLRILLTIGVIETMPDAQLFALMHPGPPAPSPKRGAPWWGLRSQIGPFAKGILCQHLSRSSPVLAIMACVFGGVLDEHGHIPPGEETLWAVGWVCYFTAISQYLVMGPVRQPRGGCQGARAVRRAADRGAAGLGQPLRRHAPGGLRGGRGVRLPDRPAARRFGRADGRGRHPVYCGAPRVIPEPAPSAPAPRCRASARSTRRW